MDTTTLTLAVDSSAVNNASVALREMAAQGLKAETVAAKFANTAQSQGRAINSGIVKNAAAAADSIKGLTSATSALAGAQDFSKTTSSLAAAAAQAKATTSEVRALSTAVVSIGNAPALSFAVPRASTGQQIAQAPVSVAARNIIGNAGQLAVSAPVQNVAAASVRDLSTAARELETKEIGAVNTALTATAAKAAEAAKSVSALDAALARTKPADAGISAISSAAKAQQAAIPGASTALANAAGKQNNQAALFPAVSAETSASIDKYIKQLQQEQAMLGKTAREVELYKLALKGASAEQLKAADNSLKLAEAYKKGQTIGTVLKVGAAAAAYAAFEGVSGLVTNVKAAIDAADHLNDLSKKTGIAVDTLGGLGFAASQAGGDLETIAKAAGNLNKSIAQAARGNKEYVATFAAIGVDIRDAAGNIKSTDTVLAEVADKFSQYGDGANKSAIATKLMKEAGAGLIGMLNDGGKGLRENVDYYKKYAGVTQEVADKSDQFNDTVGKLNLLSGAYSRTLASELMPALQSVADELLRSKENGDGLISFIKSLAGSVNELTASLISGAREAGGFWNAIFIGGTVNPFKSLQSNIAGYREELKQANADLERFKKEGKDTAPIEASIRRTTARLNIVQGQADREAMANNGPGRQDPRKFDPRIKPEEKPDAPSVPKVKGAGRGSSEASQVLREQLADDVSVFKAALDAEKATLAFHQREMQAIYQAGGISLKDFYEDKRQSIADGVKAEIAELDKEIARLKQYRDEIKDPSERVKVGKQINQIGQQKEKLQTAADRDVKLTNKEEEASFRQLNDQIDNYRANLLQLQGDELGAARIRADIAKGNASILAAQSGGQISQADVDRQTALTEAANKFAEVQRQAGLLAQSASRAQEAAYLVSEQGGKSLLETENAIYAVRAKELEQLGALATKAKELADASTDPKIKQYAADLALAYAKAAAAIDPALQRLQAAQRDLASGIANTLNQGLATLPQEYNQRRLDANKEAKEEKARYDQRIQVQQGYLAQAASNEERARIRKRIKDLEAQRESAGGESKGKSLLQAVNANVVQPMASQAFATVNKLLVTDPLQKYLEGQFKSMTEGGGAFAGFFKDALGIKDAKVDPKVLAEQAAAQATNALSSSVAAQTAAADASTTALNALANAANAAAGASPSRPLLVEAGSRQAAPSMGDFTRADRALEAAQSPAATDPATTAALVDARTSTERFADTAKSAGTVVSALAASAGKGSSALGLLPSVVNLFQASVAAMKVGSAASAGSGGLFGSIAGLFGGSGGAGGMATNSAGMAAGQGVSASALANLMEYGLAEGGLVKGPGTGKSDSIPARLSNGEFVMPAEQTKAFLPVLEQMRSGPTSAFAGATRYHTGGIVGQKPDEARSALAAAALKAGEVPAILMKQEEVLRRDDPRHRDNLGADVFAKIMAGEKPWAQSLVAQAAKQAPDSSVGSLLKNIAGDTKQGDENSASVLSGLLSRLGVQDEPATASALRVAGARELGGPVSAGKLYRVNEKRPELLNVGNKQYLMMGSQGGKVDPNPQQGADGRPIAVTNNFHLGAPTNHSTQRQMALAASRSISDAARRNG